MALAGDLTAWMQTLALTHEAARRWKPKRLQHRLFSLAGRLATHGRRRLLHLAAAGPLTGLVLDGLRRLRHLLAPPTVDPAPG